MMLKGLEFEGRPVWAEISLAALAHNLRAIRRRVGRQRKILAIVKANAYGHGAVGVARALERAGADCFGVTCTSEGIELREAGIRRPILLLTGTWPGEERRMLSARLTPAVTRVAQLAELERAAARARLARPLGFHLKIDTGMNRLGVGVAEIPAFVRALGDCPHLRLVATFTHFSAAEDFTRETAEQQQKRFAAALAALRAAGISPGLVHLANSAAIASRPSTWADMVRPGAVLYGYHQSYEPPKYGRRAAREMPLRAVLSLRARVVLVREIAAGEGVGYNSKFVAARRSRIAVIAAGYADGIIRRRGNNGEVLVRGRRAPLVGSVSMDLAMVDVTRVPGVRVGDVVTIYGADGGDAIRADQVAKELGTVTSDLLCAIGARVPRFYLR
jgi:alanine racemase